MGTFAAVPFFKLRLAEGNIRKSHATAAKDAELKASLEAHGVLMNLIVSTAPKGIKQVHAGGRRLAMLTQLVTEKKLPKGYPVPCYVLGDDENPEEAALIENTMRVEMHPLDEFESYSRLHHDHGMTIEQIAARFGRASLDVRKRLKLGNVAPKLRQACRDGDIDLDTLAAFASTEDMERQLECYTALTAQHNYINSYTVRNWLTEALYEAGRGLPALISVEDYEDRGGKTSSDLFANKIYLHDTELVDTMVKEKLTAVADQVRAEGWKWVEVDLDFFNTGNNSIAQTLDPVPAPEAEIPAELLERQKELEAKVGELEETLQDDAENDTLTNEELEAAEEALSVAESDLYNVQEQIEELAQYSDEQKAIAGALITVDNNGLRILRGRVKKADAKKAKEPDSMTWTGAPDEEAKLSQVLLDDLSKWKLIAARLDLYYNTAIAADLMLFSIAWIVAQDPMDRDFYIAPLKISPSMPALQTTIDDERGTSSIRELDGCRESLNLGWLNTEDMIQSMRDFRELSQQDKTKLMAWCAAKCLNTSGEMLSAIMEDCETKPAKYWRPNATNYFKRAPKGVILKAGAEMFNDEDWGDSHTNKAKTDIAHILEERIEQMPLAECWLPEQMR